MKLTRWKLQKALSSSGVERIPIRPWNCLMQRGKLDFQRFEIRRGWCNDILIKYSKASSDVLHSPRCWLQKKQTVANRQSYEESVYIFTLHFHGSREFYLNTPINSILRCLSLSKVCCLCKYVVEQLEMW